MCSSKHLVSAVTLDGNNTEHFYFKFVGWSKTEGQKGCICNSLTSVTNDEVGLLHVLCYGVFESKGLQCDVRTAVSSWKNRSSSNLKNQTLISTCLYSLRGEEEQFNINMVTSLSPKV